MSLITPFAELTRNERILTVFAIGAATICLLHFIIFELPRLWRGFREDLRRAAAWVRAHRSDAPTRPQWTEPADIDEAYYRRCLDAAAQTGSPWPPEKHNNTNQSTVRKFSKGVH